VTKVTRTPGPPPVKPAHGAQGKVDPVPSEKGRPRWEQLHYLMPTLVLAVLGVVLVANLLVLTALLARNPPAPAVAVQPPPRVEPGQLDEAIGQLKTETNRLASVKLTTEPGKPGQEPPPVWTSAAAKLEAAIKALDAARTDSSEQGKALKEAGGKLAEAVTALNDAVGKTTEAAKGVAVTGSKLGLSQGNFTDEVIRLQVAVQRLNGLLLAAQRSDDPQDVLIAGLHSETGLDFRTWAAAVKPLFTDLPYRESRGYRLGFVLVTGENVQPVLPLDADRQASNPDEAFGKIQLRQGSRDFTDRLGELLPGQFGKPGRRRRCILIASSQCAAPPARWQNLGVDVVLVGTGKGPFPPPDAAGWLRFCAEQQGALVCLRPADGQPPAALVGELGWQLSRLALPRNDRPLK
jgi:hypothetical protein